MNWHPDRLTDSMSRFALRGLMLAALALPTTAFAAGQSALPLASRAVLLQGLAQGGKVLAAIQLSKLLNRG